MDDGPLVELAAAAGARRAENWKMKTLRDPSGPPRMRKFLREGDFDVVQCYGLRAESLTRWIARALGISVHTAKFHVGRLLDKLDASGRTDAVAHAARIGVLHL